MQGALAQAPRHSAPFRVNLRSGVVLAFGDAELLAHVFNELIRADGHADDVVADFQVVLADGRLVIHGVERGDPFYLGRRQTQVISDIFHGLARQPATVFFLRQPEGGQQGGLFGRVLFQDRVELL